MLGVIRYKVRELDMFVVTQALCLSILIGDTDNRPSYPFVHKTLINRCIQNYNASITFGGGPPRLRGQTDFNVFVVEFDGIAVREFERGLTVRLQLGQQLAGVGFSERL